MKHFLVLLAVFALAAPLPAQWSGNPAVNLAVCTHTGDQAVPKIAATGDGRTWIGWFDNTSGSYAVYVQLLDADGVEQFPHNGLLVSANPQSSSLVDWDLIADSSGNCVLAFTDTRAGSDLDIYAYKISPTGVFLWGANGVTLSSNTDFEPSPKVTETSDGNFVFVWPRIPNSGTGSIRMQKLDASGVPQYAADGIPIQGGTNEHPAFCDVVAADNGSFVVEWVRDIASFQSPRHIRAQKFSAAGAAIWAAPVAVYDLNSVPIAYQPIVQTDGAGGALFCWHRSLNNVYDSLVQHLDASGAEVFAHNGLLVSTEPNRYRLDPSLAFLPASGDLIVGFEKTDLNQSQWGVGIQRISSAGVRLWTDNGIELLPVNGTAKDFVRCVPYGNGAELFCFDQPNTPLLQHRVLGFRVDGLGAEVWNGAPVVLSSILSSKDDLDVVVDGSGMARAVWHDERTDSGDIYVQNANVDGSLGPPSACDGSTYCVGAPNSVGLGASIAWSGSTSLALNDFVLHATGAPAHKTALFVYGSTQVQVPLGDGFRCIGGTVKRIQPAGSTDGAGAFSRYFDFTQPPANSGSGQILPGSTWNFQLYYRDPQGPLGSGINLSNGLSASFCP
jgi:hypothetical protein